MKNVIKMTLADQIYTILREDIINQTIKCGEKLTLNALQERFAISSTPIREAMKRLSQEGLIEHVTNVGAKVIEINAKEIQEIYDLCSILDSGALKLALSSNQKKSFIFDLILSIELQEDSLKAGDMAKFKLHSDDFHDIFYRYADNSRLYSATQKLRSQLSILTTIYQSFTVAWSVVLSEHKSIVEAIQNECYDEAVCLLSQHFEHAKTYLLDNIKNNNTD
ncbi:GntR family transcriptional regulator [Brassicibacter mesophilus]|uniref:GntR family transcriptional regulator n=1 Tax=Brassicibacter mesophilus TaxID=745119 RepID=UPI003D1B1142